MKYNSPIRGRFDSSNVIVYQDLLVYSTRRSKCENLELSSECILVPTIFSSCHIRVIWALYIYIRAKVTFSGQIRIDMMQLS